MFIIDRDQRASVQASVAAALAHGGRFSHRATITGHDAARIDLETSGEVVLDADGRAAFASGTCRDVTEERRREATLQVFADFVDSVHIALSVWHQDDGDPRQLRLWSCNAATERLLGRDLRRALGDSLASLLPSVAEPLRDAMLAFGADHPVRELPAVRFPDLPSSPTFAVKLFSLRERGIGLALEDITERVRAQTWQQCERRALEMLAASAPLGDILDVLAACIESLSPGDVASVLVVDETGTRLRHASAPSLPEAFTSAIDGIAIGPASGCCGAAVHRRQSVHAPDIAADPNLEPWVEVLEAHDLRACFSVPILTSEGNPLGTFAVYSRALGGPSPVARELAQRAAHVAAMVIERRHLDDQLRALSTRVESAREDERTRIAREIHDQLGQALTALMLDIAWTARRTSGDSPVARKLEEMQLASEDLLDLVRRIASALRPTLLDDVGLQATIEWQAEDFARRSGIACEVSAHLGDVQLDKTLATSVFRIFQEALTNVARHAKATRVQVDLWLARGILRLDVADNGIGIAKAPARAHSLGLLGMRERARRLGGDCTVAPLPQGGTIVEVRVPLQFPRAKSVPPAG